MFDKYLNSYGTARATGQAQQRRENGQRDAVQDPRVVAGDKEKRHDDAQTRCKHAQPRQHDSEEGGSRSLLQKRYSARPGKSRGQQRRHAVLG